MTDEAVMMWRWRFVVTTLVVVAGLIAWRSFDLQILQHDFLLGQGDARNVRIEPLAAHRGLILDRTGQPLAVSTPVVSLWANPRKLLQARDRWADLANSLSIELDALENKILSNQTRSFIYLRRHLPPVAADVVLALKVPGVQGMTEFRRYYPAGEVASHVVGMTNIDDAGQEGLELSYNDWLAGHAGRKKVIKDLLGRVIRNVALIEDAQSGKDLYSSIDLRIQYMAHRALADAVAENHADAGMLVTIDVLTGEILAMVNQPAFNPNNRLRVDPASFRNRSVTDVFEPGSTLKTMAVAAALESGEFQPGTIIDTAPGYVRVGQKTIRDHHNYGAIDLTTVLAKSSNVGMTKLVLALTAEPLVGMLSRVGLGQVTESGFPGESSGVLPYRSRWRDIELATLSYGYGASVTALQLAQAYAVIAADGIRRPVSLLRVDDDGVDGERVMSASVAKSLRNMLQMASSAEGTARLAHVPGYRVAGKTGTVHKLVNGSYADDQYLSLFVGMAPINNPRLVTVVVVDNPRGNQYYGGQVAAPVFSSVMAGALRILDVIPDAQTEVSSLSPSAPALAGRG